MVTGRHGCRIVQCGDNNAHPLPVWASLGWWWCGVCLCRLHAHREWSLFLSLAVFFFRQVTTKTNVKLRITSVRIGRKWKNSRKVDFLGRRRQKDWCSYSDFWIKGPIFHKKKKISTLLHTWRHRGFYFLAFLRDLAAEFHRNYFKFIVCPFSRTEENVHLLMDKSLRLQLSQKESC